MPTRRKGELSNFRDLGAWERQQNDFTAQAPYGTPQIKTYLIFLDWSVLAT